jgi:sulfonate transport system ATP-binding protein
MVAGEAIVPRRRVIMMDFNPILHVNNVQKKDGNQSVLKGINLSIYEGEFVSIVGKSGCGKSTLLRIIAGLEDSNEGLVKVNGERLTSINKYARIMFQDGRLIPWKTILQNVGLGLTGDWKPKAMYVLNHVGLKERANHYPSLLSGGQKQRVALARALVHEPKLLLFDDPLATVDALTRIDLQNLFESVWKENRLSAILVTHDVEEALLLSDRVIIMRDGEVVLNKLIDLPRPRSRSNPTFHHYTEEILDVIMEENKEKKMVIK